jgi:hypothetical protein
LVVCRRPSLARKTVIDRSRGILPSVACWDGAWLIYGRKQQEGSRVIDGQECSHMLFNSACWRMQHRSVAVFRSRHLLRYGMEICRRGKHPGVSLQMQPLVHPFACIMYCTKHWGSIIFAWWPHLLPNVIYFQQLRSCDILRNLTIWSWSTYQTRPYPMV